MARNADAESDAEALFDAALAYADAIVRKFPNLTPDKKMKLFREKLEEFMDKQKRKGKQSKMEAHILSPTETALKERPWLAEIFKASRATAPSSVRTRWAD